MVTLMLNVGDGIRAARPEFILLFLKICFILGITFLVTHWLRKASASTRYRVWIAAFFSMALIPLMPFSLEFHGPSWAMGAATEMPEANQLATTPISPVQGASTDNNLIKLPIESASQASELAASPTSANGLTAHASTMDWLMSLLIATYIAILAWGLMKLCWNLVSAWRQTRQGRMPTTAERERLEALSGTSARGDLGKVVVICRQELMPRAWGFPRAKLLLPEQALAWDDDQLRNVLLHEWAHVHRQDFLFGIMVDLVALAYWPLLPVWSARKQLALERERACDEAVLGQGIRPSTYAQQLLTLACGLRGHHHGPAHAMHFSRGSHLKARISSILTFKTSNASRLTQVCLSVALIATGLCLAALTPTQPPPSPPEQPVLDPWLASLSSQLNQTPEAKQPNPTARLLPGSRSSESPLVALAHRAILDQEVEAIPALIGLLGDMTPIEEPELTFPKFWQPANRYWQHPAPGETAAIALASLGGAAVQPLINALESDNPDVRRNAAWALGEIRGHEDQHLAIDRLIEVLQNDSDSKVCVAAAYALGETKSPRAGRVLMEALDDPSDPEIRQMAAWALGEIRYKRAVVPLVQRLLDEPDWRVREMAVRALGEIGSSDAMDVLIIALDDEHEDVRAVAKWALQEVDHSDFDFD